MNSTADTATKRAEKTAPSADGPRWRTKLIEIQEGFPSPWRELGKDQIFENLFKSTISESNKLKHSRFYEDNEALKSYFGAPNLPDYSGCKKAIMKNDCSKSEDVIKELIELFFGLPNWGHPQTMCNVNPAGNTASIIGASLAKLFNADIMEGEYSWNVAKAEIESGAMLSELMGWDPEKSGGVYTFGGTGSYLYALKLALASVFGRDIRNKGVREDGQVLVADAGHYAKYTCADWTGLGINNIRSISLDSSNGINIAHLSDEMKKCKKEGKPIVMVVCTVGSTDAFAIDSISEVKSLIDSYENAKGYSKPLLYADAVIGWSFMAFKGYDFNKNPLEFSKAALSVIKSNFTQIESLTMVDAMGIDFHKTGWAPFNSSFFLVKDYAKFTSLLARPRPPYLEYLTSYNPFIFTLETSRGAAGALAGWSSMKFFGYEGYRVMLGRIIEITVFFRGLIEKEKNIVCVNADNYGFVNLFRVYPKHIDAKAQYHAELNDINYRESLKAHNNLQQLVVHKLFVMLRDPKEKIPGWESPPYISLTHGYRAPLYAPNENDADHLIHAIKAFPMSPFSSEISMLLMRNYVLKARDIVMQELTKQDQDNPFASMQREPEEALQSKCQSEREPVPAESIISKAKINIDILKNHPLLFHCSESQLTKLLQKSVLLTMEHSEVLFREGDNADKIYIILEGKVRIYKPDSRQKEIEIAVLSKAELFGEMAISSTGKRSACASAIGTCTLIAIEGSDFFDLILH